MQPATQGSIFFCGVAIHNVATHRRVALGLAQVPEGRQVFPSLSVDDNLRLGAVSRKDKTIDSALLVEQNANAALAIADRGYIMKTGRITICGSGNQLLLDPRVRAAYLGI